MKILLVNGYAEHVDSNGGLNKLLFHTFLNSVRQENEVRVSTVEDYRPIDEVNKFLWADLVFFQFPIYWFQVPGKLKKYLDDVFMYNEFYGTSNHYGDGGMMGDTKYIVSTTWNAPEYAFNNSSEFFEGKNVDDVLFPLYCAFKYCGFKPLVPEERALSFYDVVKNPNAKEYVNVMQKFINDNIVK